MNLSEIIKFFSARVFSSLILGFRDRRISLEFIKNVQKNFCICQEDTMNQNSWNPVKKHRLSGENFHIGARLPCLVTVFLFSLSNFIRIS